MTENQESMGETLKSTKDVERRRILWYWIGLGTYLLILLNVLRIASTLSYMILVLGAVVNLAVIVGIILLLRRAYQRLRS
jgi:hypothetical protein